MRIQGGNVDSYRIPEGDLAPTAPVASSTAVSAPTAPSAPTEPAALPRRSEALEPSAALGFMARIASVFNGLADAVRGVGRSLAEALVAPSRLFEEAAGSVLLVVGKGISTVQSLFYLEPAGRPLTERERTLAREVFGSSLNLDVIRLKSGHAGLFSVVDSERPFVLGNAVYTKNANPLSDEDFIHELAHVLQYQSQGAGYMATSLLSQAFGKEQAYDFASPIAQGKSFAELGPEQQADLISVAHEAGAIAAGQVVRPFIVVQDDGTKVDCTPQLRAALAAMHGRS